MEVFKLIFDYGLPLNHYLITQTEFDKFTLILGFAWGIVILCLFLPFIRQGRKKAIDLFAKKYPDEQIKVVINDKNSFMYFGIIIASAFGGAFILPLFLFDNVYYYDNSIGFKSLIFWVPAYLLIVFFLFGRYLITGVLSDKRLTFVMPYKVFCKLFFKEMLNLPFKNIKSIEYDKELFFLDYMKIVKTDNKKISFYFMNNLEKTYHYISTIIDERSL